MADTRSQISYEQAGLGGVLARHSLRVPPNQREYAWTQLQVTQLFQDLANAMSNGEDYFLGTIVTIPRQTGSLEVVDGQQRLATTALLLTAIRDQLRADGDSIRVEGISNQYLMVIDMERQERRPRLALNVDDNDLFAALIAREADDPLPTATHLSHELILDAYGRATKFVHQITSVVSQTERAALLTRWVSFIEHGALVVLLQVSDDADAYRMFETLNDRGLRTSQTDLIKNYLFGRARERHDEVQAKWSYMRGALEALDDEDVTITYLRHALIAMFGFRREAAVYETVQQAAKSASSAVSLVTNLETLASLYVAGFSSDHERWNEYPQPATRRAVEVLNLFNIKPIRPLTLAMALRWEKSEMAASLKFLSVLGVRLIIASSTRTGSVEVSIAAAANEIFKGNISTRAQLLEHLQPITPGDEEFRQAMRTTRVSNARLARYYLRSLEMKAKGESEGWYIPTDDQAVINLEHVLPRKTEGNWPDWTDEQVGLNATRLGNLVLMRASDNSDLRSADFATKRPVYAASPYTLTSQVAEHSEWDQDAINDRQFGLADLAVETWPLS